MNNSILKVGLLAPYIGLASIVLVATVAMLYMTNVLNVERRSNEHLYTSISPFLCINNLGYHV